MAPDALDALLKLSPADRATLAIALWESLDDVQRDAEFPVTPDLAAELDRRLADHVAEPTSSVPWHQVRRRLARAR